MDVTVRDEEPSDQTSIRRVVEAAFAGADEADLVDRLRHDGDAIVSLVAVEGGRIIGHLMLSRMAAPFRALGLAPLAVLPGRQRRGVGGMLIRHGLAVARSRGWQAVFVLGDPAYYRRFGFDPALAAGFQSTYAGPHLMATALDAALPEARGRIDYAPAFALLR